MIAACPFCGKRNTRVIHEGARKSFVVCPCGARSPVFGGKLPLGDREAGAMELWNTRFHRPPPLEGYVTEQDNLIIYPEGGHAGDVLVSIHKTAWLRLARYLLDQVDDEFEQDPVTLDGCFDQLTEE